MDRDELIITTAKELTLAAISHKMILCNTGIPKQAAETITVFFAEMTKNVKAELDKAQ